MSEADPQMSLAVGLGAGILSFLDSIASVLPVLGFVLVIRIHTFETKLGFRSNLVSFFN